MKKYFLILQQCPLFAGVEKEDLLGLLECLGATVKRYDKNEYILREGDQADEIGILLSGKARVEQTDYFGNRSVMAGLEPGELFGESFACAGVERLPVDVVAVSAAEILLIRRRRITHTCCKACAFHERLIFNLMQVLAMKNLAFHQKITVTAKRTTREKLMAYLLLTAKKQGMDRVVIPFDRQGLADYLGVDRSGLSAEIGKLTKAGLLTARKNKFILHPKVKKDADMER